VTADRFILRATCADGARLFVGPYGLTIARENAIEYDAAEVERRRAGANDLFGMLFDAVAVGSARDRTSTR
jgi:hypothetical protein